MNISIKNLFQSSIILIILSTLVFASPVDKEATFTVKQGDKLEAALRMGSISISIWSKNEVKIKGINLTDDDARLLTFEQRSGKIEIKFKGDDSNRFELEILVPSYLMLELSTGGGNISVNDDFKSKFEAATGGGNINTKNIDGEANISTAGGNISLGDINGSVDISTAGGEISVGSINGKADISTAGGNIKIGSINNSADVSSAGGNIYISKVEGNADVSTGGGNINVEEVSGTADISTGGGNINLSGATGKVEVNTGAGNINLKNIKGYIEANTGAGNINAELFPDGKNNSDLNSGVGTITLNIPGDAKATIIATVHVDSWGDSDNDLDNIKSDFVATEVNRRGDERRIEAKYILNGGGSKIEINVGMGEVRITKLK